MKSKQTPAQEKQNQRIYDAAVAVYADPENEWLYVELEKALWPIVKHWAYAVSLDPEDREDAQQVITAHLMNAARPPSHRIPNRITGLPTSGFKPKKNAQPFSFFYGSAKNKALDILKSRRRRWVRYTRIMGVMTDAFKFELAHFSGPVFEEDKPDPIEDELPQPKKRALKAKPKNPPRYPVEDEVKRLLLTRGMTESNKARQLLLDAGHTTVQASNLLWQYRFEVFRPKPPLRKRGRPPKKKRYLGLGTL